MGKNEMDGAEGGLDFKSQIGDFRETARTERTKGTA
jgi:hypothetical protein